MFSLILVMHHIFYGTAFDKHAVSAWLTDMKEHLSYKS